MVASVQDTERQSGDSVYNTVIPAKAGICPTIVYFAYRCPRKTSRSLRVEAWTDPGLRRDDEKSVLVLKTRVTRRGQLLRRVWCQASILLLLAFTALPIQIAHAVQPDEVLADSVLEARARAISHGLRCLVCQNQSIDDSDAPLARDLRLLVRERLVAGESDAQVTDFLVARFGDFVLLKPPLKGSTLLLWLAPLLILGGGTLLVVRQFRSQKAQGAAAALSPEEERVLADLMQTTEPIASDELDTAR